MMLSLLTIAIQPANAVRFGPVPWQAGHSDEPSRTRGDFSCGRRGGRGYDAAMARIFLLLRLAAPAALLALPGCIKTAVDVVTLPVKVVTKGVGAALPSQKRRDRKRGKALRKYEECLGKEDRKARAQKRPVDQSRCGEAP
jgi:hypothetical protein